MNQSPLWQSTDLEPEIAAGDPAVLPPRDDEQEMTSITSTSETVTVFERSLNQMSKSPPRDFSVGLF